MAIIGVSHFLYAKYANNNGTVSYSDGGTMAKAVSANVEIETSDNKFYADNAVAESDESFTSGTLTVKPDDLTQEVSKVLLGLVELALTGTDAITGVTDEGAKELIYDNRQQSPFLGLGMVIKVMRSGAIKWRAVFLHKVKFAVPADAAETQGESISWQTPELTGTIYRDDTTYEAWKSEAIFTTIDQAMAYLNTRLNIAST